MPDVVPISCPLPPIKKAKPQKPRLLGQVGVVGPGTAEGRAECLLVLGISSLPSKSQPLTSYLVSCCFPGLEGSKLFHRAVIVPATHCPLLETVACSPCGMWGWKPLSTKPSSSVLSPDRCFG